MKLYADKLPDECWDCPCFRPNDEQSCGLAEDDYDKHYYRGDDAPDDAICPLKNIAEHDVEVTKQVCKDILDYVTKKTEVQHV